MIGSHERNSQKLKRKNFLIAYMQIFEDQFSCYKNTNLRCMFELAHKKKRLNLKKTQITGQIF